MGDNRREDPGENLQQDGSTNYVQRKATSLTADGDRDDSNNQMRSEQTRLDTFVSWPGNAPVEANKLAKAGFYYTGDGTAVTCFSCNKTISDWDFGDQAVQRHRALNSNCDFLLGKSRNEPLTTTSAPTSARFTSTTSEPAVVAAPSPVQQQPARSNSEQVLAEQKTWQSLGELYRESERLKTFRGWPVPYVLPEDLARAGFFWLRDQDRVQCVFCNGIVGEWERGDVPITEHHRHFPHCSYIKGHEVGNEPSSNSSEHNGPTNGGNLVNGDICGPYWQPYSGPEKGHARPYIGNHTSTLGITRHTGPKHPNYATLESRQRTYKNWPPSMPQHPDELAAAGFYYAGISDHTRCFYCDGGLRNWEKEDQPWTEHARWFGNCSFLLLVKGQAFVDEARARRPAIVAVKQEEQEPRPSTSATGGAAANAESPVFSPFRPEDINLLLQTPAAQAVIQAGMPVELVRNALVKRVQLSGTDFPSADLLYEACVAIENKVEQRFPKPQPIVSPPFPPVHQSVVNGTQVVKHAQPSSGGKSSNPGPTADLEKKTQALEIEEENRALKERQICKICMDEEVGVVLLPCGHLICCTTCAPGLSDCPLCRKPILGVVRTYFS